MCEPESVDPISNQSVPIRSDPKPLIRLFEPTVVVKVTKFELSTEKEILMISSSKEHENL